MMVIRVNGEDRPYPWPERATELALMFGTGLDGDVRLTGNTADAVAVARGLILGTGSCQPIEPPTDAPDYQPGDECYRQHDSARVFLDPVPTGEVLAREEQRLDQAQLAFWSSTPLTAHTVVERNQSWAFGSLEIPKISLMTARQQPVHRRGCLSYPLDEDMRLVLLPFEDPDGAAALAIVLRARWQDHFATWVPASRRDEAEQFVAMINEEIAEAWRRWRA